MKTFLDLHADVEDYFAQLALNRHDTEAVYQYILSTLDTALAKQDHSAIPQLIPYIESGEGYLAFQYIGKIHRILLLLNIIALEQKFHQPLFSEGCYDFEALWEKYMLVLFSFRRLLFQLSDSSSDEAVCYLQAHPISYLAAYSIIQHDLIIPDQDLYDKLSSVYAAHWSENDHQQFYQLLSSSEDRNT